MGFAASLADQLERSTQRERWLRDPVAWVEERLGEEMWSRQKEIMRAVAENPQVAVQSGHGIGKSWLASRLVAWWLDTRPQGTDTFVVTTAPTAQQVQVVLWRYITDIWQTHDLPGRVTGGTVPAWKMDGQVVAFGRKPSDYNESAFQGVHAEHLLVILDEACGIPEQLWNACHSLATGDENHILAIGNPDTTSSHFHKVCTTEAGWRRIKISSMDSPNFTGEPVSEKMAKSLVKRDWVQRSRERWGATSSLFKAKILGEWADDEDGLIPLSWVTQANRRWQEWSDQFDGIHEPKGRKIFGVDVGHMGEDRTVIATRQGPVIWELESWAKQDTVAVVNLIEARLDATVQGLAVVDGIGVGAGVVDVLRSHRKNVRSFIASHSTGDLRESSNSQTFRNLRSASWWHLRELLDPALGATLCLPPDDDLTADLTAPRWEPVTGGKIQVESKDDIKKRLGRSTDYGDAVVMVMWADQYRDDRPGADKSQRLRPVAYANKGGSWA